MFGIGAIVLAVVAILMAMSAASTANDLAKRVSPLEAQNKVDRGAPTLPP